MSEFSRDIDSQRKLSQVRQGVAPDDCDGTVAESLLPTVESLRGSADLRPHRPPCARSAEGMRKITAVTKTCLFGHVFRSPAVVDWHQETVAGRTAFSARTS